MSDAALRTVRVAPRLARRRSVRPAIERWLREAEPGRHGLPAGAILVLRRLRAPWPQVVHPELAARYAVLADAVGEAARPAHGGRSEQAVWFADQAELLACIARDALAGELAGHWWWRVLLPRGAVDAAQACWVQHARAAPQALARMPARAALDWLACWPEAQRSRFTHALAQSFPVAPRVLAWMQGREAEPARAPVHARASMPASGCEREQQQVGGRLLALCVAIARDPGAGAEIPRSAPAAGPRDVPASPRRPLPQEDAAVPEQDTPARWRSVGGKQVERVAPNPATAADAALQAATLPGSRSMPRARQPWPPSRGSPASMQHAAAPTAMPPACAVRAAPDPNVAVQDPAAVSQVRIAPPRAGAQPALATDFAGTLFLLNAALQMGLYAEFTEPLRAGLPCSPWRFLLAAGAALGGRAFSRDPLAAWLRTRDAALRRPRRPWQRACAALVHADCARLGIAVVADARVPWPGLRARIASALDAAPARAAAPMLLRLPGRLVDAGDRIDLTIALADLPLPVRLSGLDRDPGWIPAAGCDVRFHFA